MGSSDYLFNKFRDNRTQHVGGVDQRDGVGYKQKENCHLWFSVMFRLNAKWALLLLNILN